MAKEPTVLDISKFQLDAFKATAEVKMKMMQAYADFNYRMMQVVQLQTQVEIEQTKLTILRKSLLTFVAAEQQARRQVKAAKQEAKKSSKAIRDLNHLLFGETASTALIPLGWQGFRFLTLQASTSTAIQLSRVSCDSGDRLGSGFYNAARPDEAVADAPSTIVKALSLMDWARRRTLVPCLGSGAQNRLADLLTILGSGADAALSRSQAELAQAEKELARIRETSWDNLDVHDEKPKK